MVGDCIRGTVRSGGLLFFYGGWVVVVVPFEKLNEAGQVLWDEVTEEYELRPDELRVLLSACKTADRIVQLEKALEGEPLTVMGSMKQLVAHPLIAEIRQQRSAQASYLKQLGLLDDDSASVSNGFGPMSRSDSARLAARTRWAKAKSA